MMVERAFIIRLQTATEILQMSAELGVNPETDRPTTLLVYLSRHCQIQIIAVLEYLDRYSALRSDISLFAGFTLS